MSKQDDGKRVCVGFTTYAGAKYCRAELFKSIANYTYPDFDVLIVTNSGEEDAQDLREHARILEADGREVHVHVVAEKDDLPERQVVINRNALREHFLAGDWTHLFSLDNDVLCPPDVIERLFATEKEIVSGLYLMPRATNDGKVVILPCACVVLPNGVQCQLSLIDALQPRLIETDFTGLGCALIPRKYLEAVAFRRREGEGEDRGSTEDAPFFYDVREKFGVSPWLDTRIRCKHLKFPSGDSRNAPLDPDRYKIQVKKK